MPFLAVVTLLKMWVYRFLFKAILDSFWHMLKKNPMVILFQNSEGLHDFIIPQLCTRAVTSSLPHKQAILMTSVLEYWKGSCLYLFPIVVPLGCFISTVLTLL